MINTRLHHEWIIKKCLQLCYRSQKAAQYSSSENANRQDVLGPSGGGESGFLANWLQRFYEVSLKIALLLGAALERCSESVTANQSQHVEKAGITSPVSRFIPLLASRMLKPSL